MNEADELRRAQTAVGKAIVTVRDLLRAYEADIEAHMPVYEPSVSRRHYNEGFITARSASASALEHLLNMLISDAVQP